MMQHTANQPARIETKDVSVRSFGIGYPLFAAARSPLPDRPPMVTLVLGVEIATDDLDLHTTYIVTPAGRFPAVDLQFGMTPAEAAAAVLNPQNPSIPTF